MRSVDSSSAVILRRSTLDANACIVASAGAKSACIYLPPFVTGELLSYADAATPGNVWNPMVVGFAGRSAAGADRIYAVVA